MTLQTDDDTRTYANPAGTSFNGPPAFVASTLFLYVVESDGVTRTLIPSSDYTVSQLGRNRGTRIVLGAPIPSPAGKTLLIQRTVPYNQLTDITNQGDFNAQVLEAGLDTLGMQTQQLARQVGRALRFPDNVLVDFDPVIPTPLNPLDIIQVRPDGLGLVMSPAPAIATVADGAVVDATVSPIAGIQGTKLNFTQGTAGSKNRDVQSKQREDWSAGDFNGIDMTGVADSTAALTAFIQDMALNGRDGQLPAGVIRVTDTIRIGNRTTGPSTLNGVTLRGAGWGKTATTMNVNAAATRIVYDGPSDGRPVVYIDGPISGVRLEGFMIDCNGKDVVGIRSMRSFHQTVKQVLIVNWCNNFALEIGANTPNVGYGGAAPISHYYEQLDFQNPGVGAHGVDIGNGNGNCNQLTFVRCYLDRYHPSVSTMSVRLGYCDHIQFIACHAAQTGSVGASGISYMVRAQPGFPQFPQNIEVIGGSQAGGVSFDNSLAVWDAGPYPGIIFDTYKTADGAPVPPLTANGGARAPSYMFRGVTDNGVRFGWSPEVAAQVIPAASTIAPDTEIVQLTTSVAVDIATITPPRSAFSVANGIYRITLIPTFTETTSVFMRLVTGGNIATPMRLKNLVAVTLVYSEGTGLWSLENGGATSGTYTPSASALTNLDSVTPRECQWMRVGNTVTVTGRFEVDATAAAYAATSFEFNLPIVPSAFVNNWECAGVGSTAGPAGAAGTVNQACLVIGSGTNARLQWQANVTTAQGLFFTLTYRLI